MDHVIRRTGYTMSIDSPMTTQQHLNSDTDLGTKKMVTPIQPLAKSAYSDVLEDSYRNTFDALSARLAAENNWFARKNLLLNTLKALEIVIQHENLTARKAGEKVEDSRAEFLKVVPYFVGAILEKLAEPGLSSVEQAAFYVLSAHPEHQEAAERWVEADPKHMKALRKFLKANTYYRKIMEDGTKTYSDFLTA